MIFVMFWVVCIIACGIIASNKGRSIISWVLLAVLFGPLMLILAGVVSNRRSNRDVATPPRRVAQQRSEAVTRRRMDAFWREHDLRRIDYKDSKRVEDYRDWLSSFKREHRR